MMNKKKVVALMLAMSIAPFSAITLAQPIAIQTPFCTKLSGAIAPGRVPAMQTQIIYGPYTVKCGTTSHHFNVRGASGQVPVIVQQLRDGGWVSVTPRTYDPSGRFGAGTFRLVLDNAQGQTSVSYKGDYSVPM